jgi:hypothetical protein
VAPLEAINNKMCIGNHKEDCYDRSYALGSIS